jgi:hypothetical protein
MVVRARAPLAEVIGKNSGLNRNRTCDPLDVNLTLEN